MSGGFKHRGVIEGYYGKPWSHADRLWVIEQLGRLGMNRYVYAPKDDPLHLARWREGYPAERMREFAELIEAGARCGVQVGFAVSPGRSMSFASAEDRKLLLEKFHAFAELGAEFLSLALDDVPSELRQEDRGQFASLGEAHAAIQSELQHALPAVTWWLVPTDYLGVEPTDYLEYLGEKLAPEIEIGWTGRTICSPSIPAAEAAQRAATLRRKVLIWDNTPVADGPMRAMLHLGPYRGRDRKLPEYSSGILLNPMQQARASLFVLESAAAFMSGDDVEAAWERAARELAADDAEALSLFARAHRFSALAPDDRDTELEAAWREGALDRVRQCVAARLTANQTLREHAVPALLAEIEPWLDSHRRETRRMEAALEVLRELESDAARSAKLVAFMNMEGRFTLEPENGKVSYGPRRALYAQLASMRDDTMGFGSDPVLFLDRCLGDEIVAFAERRALEVLGPA